jgi:hypothetical protein
MTTWRMHVAWWITMTTHTHTHSVGLSGRLISPTQRPLPDNTVVTRDIRTLGEIRTRISLHAIGHLPNSRQKYGRAEETGAVIITPSIIWRHIVSICTPGKEGKQTDVSTVSVGCFVFEVLRHTWLSLCVQRYCGSLRSVNVGSYSYVQEDVWR